MNFYFLSRSLARVLTVVQIVLLTLKLSGSLTYPWWQIFLPTLVPLCLVGGFVLFLFMTFEK